MPFFPSSLRDDGYDIADDNFVDSSDGTRDFEVFSNPLISGATGHYRNGADQLRISIPGFSSSAARADILPRWVCVARDRYRYQGTWIIFLDMELSNWAWYLVSKAYYWDRFFSHQRISISTDPEVREEVWNVTRFGWNGCGRFRLDAVWIWWNAEARIARTCLRLYAILKELWRRLDEEFPGRMLLAEANQWPADFRAYFADGNEFHMAFDFLLIEDVHGGETGRSQPMTEILEQTRSIRSAASGVFSCVTMTSCHSKW